MIQQLAIIGLIASVWTVPLMAYSSRENKLETTINQIEEVKLKSLAGHTFLHQYRNGNIYRVTYDENTVTWTGIEGSDAGRSETDHYKFIRLSPKVFLVQWQEQDSTIVHLTYDLRLKRVAASIQWQSEFILIPGTIEWLK